MPNYTNFSVMKFATDAQDILLLRALEAKYFYYQLRKALEEELNEKFDATVPLLPFLLDKYYKTIIKYADVKTTEKFRVFLIACRKIVPELSVQLKTIAQELAENNKDGWHEKLNLPEQQDVFDEFITFINTTPDSIKAKAQLWCDFINTISEKEGFQEIEEFTLIKMVKMIITENDFFQEAIDYKIPPSFLVACVHNERKLRANMSDNLQEDVTLLLRYCAKAIESPPLAAPAATFLKVGV
jgi:hypothetical protein